MARPEAETGLFQAERHLSERWEGKEALSRGSETVAFCGFKLLATTKHEASTFSGEQIRAKLRKTEQGKVI
jgi:hypothetical protein